MYGIAWNCHHRNWNWSGIVFIGIGIGIELPFGLGTGFGIGVELPSSELELELNCQNGIDPSSELNYASFNIYTCFDVFFCHYYICDSTLYSNAHKTRNIS